MTVYLFYMKQPEEREAYIYAHTDSKEFARRFESERNMKLFIKTKVEMTKKEYKSFRDKYRAYILSLGSFYTKDKNDFGKRIIVDVLCTWREEECVLKAPEKIWDEYRKCLIDLRMLKDEYIQALEKLMYFQFYGFYKKYSSDYDAFYDPYYTSYGPCKNFKLDEMMYNVTYDELAMFLRFYQNTFK